MQHRCNSTSGDPGLEAHLVRTEAKWRRHSRVRGFTGGEADPRANQQRREGECQAGDCELEKRTTTEAHP